MTTAAANSISLAEKVLIDSIAACAGFKTWVGANNSTEAATRIYHDALPPPADGVRHTLAELQLLRPRAMVWTDEDSGFHRVLDAVGSEYEFTDNGRLMLDIEDNIPAVIRNNPAEIERRFKNTLGAIIDGLCTLAGTAGYLAFNRIGLEAGPVRMPEDRIETDGDAIGALLYVAWNS